MRLNGWNTSFAIAPLTVSKTSTISYSYKLDNDTVKTIPKGTNVSAFVQFFYPYNKGEQTANFAKSPASDTIVTVTGNFPQTGTLDTLQLASQLQGGSWGAVNGSILYISQVTIATPFDVQTFAGDVPKGGSIVLLGGKKYLKIRLDGWNTSFPIAPINVKKQTTDSFTYKLDKDTAKYTLPVNAFFQFFYPYNKGEQTANFATSPASDTFALRIGTFNVAGTLDTLQLASQLQGGSWGAVAGSILYISEMVFTNPVVSVSSITAADMTLKTFPNPATDILKVSLAGMNGFVTLYDITGKVVLKQAVTGDVQEISVSNLNNGIYFLKAYNSSGSSYTGKIVKR
jgi:hypothetical protein